MGMLGVMVLPGRLIFTPLGGRWPRTNVTAVGFALGAVAAVALLLGRGSLATWTFVVLFGVGFGAIAPARAALLAEAFGPARYGEISGVLTFVLSLARALAPVGTSLLYEASVGGPFRAYDAVIVSWVVLALGSVVAVLYAGRSSPGRVRSA